MRESLASISHSSDPQLNAMNLRAEVAQTSGNSPSFDKLIEQAFSHSGLRAKMLQLSLIEKCDEERAKSILMRIEIPSGESQKNMTSARRVSAMIWYYRAIYKLIIRCQQWLKRSLFGNALYVQVPQKKQPN